MPDSGNLVGGRSRIIRNFAHHRGEALVHDYGYKMALGYNPRSTTSWKGERPNTRMGVYGLLERRFDEVRMKFEKASLTRDRKLDEIARRSEKRELSRPQADLETKRIEREFALELTPHEQA
jgi:hypothetical protein